MKNRQVELFAVTPPGFEQVCAAELLHLGIEPVAAERGGVSFGGKLREIYLANLWLRSAARVLVRFGDIQARDFPSLFRKAVRLGWGEFIRPGQPLRFRVSSRGSRLQHGKRIAETLEMAARQALGVRDGDVQGPEQLILVRLEDDRCVLSIDSSGDLLHRRGYRESQGAAPLRENLAAAILLLLGWQAPEPLVDPFCGSGTFAVEAALLASGTAPGRNREFAFMQWPGFRHGLWNLLLGEAARSIREVEGPIVFASDLDGDVLEVARANAVRAGVSELIEWRCEDALQVELPARSGVLVANPPYGARLETPETIAHIFRQLDRLFLDDWSSWRKGIITPDPSLFELWRARRRLRFRNGGLPVVLLAD